MADLEVTSLVLDYKWKGTIQRPDTIKDPKTILSDYINFFGEDTFQASFKMIKDSIYDLRFDAVNLNKMGFSVDQVLVSSGSLPKHRRMASDEINEDSKLGFSLPGAFPLTRQTPERTLRQGDRFTKFHFEFNFMIYITATAKDYRIHQVDSFMMDHLSSSVTNRTWTDFELVASTNKKSFLVNKFILSARSPVFASLFSKDPSVPSLIEFVHSTCMEQFIKFIYTGQLVGFACCQHNLGKLASKYQLQTLQQLCTSAQSCKSNISRTTEKNTMIKSEGVEAKVDYPSKTAAVILPWDLEWVIKDTTLGDCVYSKSFKDQNGTEVYRVKAKLRRKRPDTPLKTMVSADGIDESLHVYKLKISITANDSHLKTRNRLINKVGFKTFISSGEWNKIKFTEKLPPTSGSKFTAKEILKRWELTSCKKASIPLQITFYIDQMTTIPNYDFKFIDATWSDQLWSAAVNQSSTDFEFLIGDESIAAHRFILSSRSHVFAGMLDSGMTESRTGQMHLVDDDLSTFRHLLEFLYTGKLPSTADRAKLFLLADKYRVENLMTLCNPPEKDDVVISELPFPKNLHRLASFCESFLHIF